VSPIQGVFDQLHRRVADATAGLGRRVDVASLGVSDRRGQLELGAPGLVSPNGACRMVRAADGWIAVNLARREDHDLVPAWLRGEFGESAWPQVERLARSRQRCELVADAALLGLPVAAVGEVRATHLDVPNVIEGPRRPRFAGAPLTVVDLSALWAGPMCGAILAAMGAEVIKVEATSRPDPTRTSTPEFFKHLNGGKADIVIDLSNPEHIRWLREEVAAADIVISSARPRGLASLGLSPREKLQRSPGGVWIAITGYGWYGESSDRVAFGDDAAAAGGLVRWTEAGEPHFLGDALADPLTGMMAAVGGLEALLDGGGRIANVSLARVAAGAAFQAGLVGRA
jgi:crotonobetainyl-CoA:carnitine CoA-transferase CaiB-like acyl-CoA transferase